MSLIVEFVEGVVLVFECVDYVYGGDGFVFGVFCVGDGVVDYVF